MARTWIVGLDGSEDSLHALEWAIDQAGGSDVRIIVLATWAAPITTGVVPDGFAVSDWHHLEQSMLHVVQGVVAERARDGVPLEAMVAQGPAAHVLIESSRHADMLVVGGRGLGRVKGLMMGSVSQRCASQSVVPTAVVGAAVPLGPARRMVVGFDGSPNARRALEWALRFAHDNASITVVDALGVAPWLPADDVRARFPAEVEAAEEEFQAHMADLDPSHRAERRFVIGDPRVKLAEAVQGADLLVVGARGRGRVGALLLGSTTTWMLNKAVCATVVIPAVDAAA